MPVVRDVLVFLPAVGYGPLPVDETRVVRRDGVWDDDGDDCVGGVGLEAEFSGVDVQHGCGGEGVDCWG